MQIRFASKLKYNYQQILGEPWVHPILFLWHAFRVRGIRRWRGHFPSPHRFEAAYWRSPVFILYLNNGIYFLIGRGQLTPFY